MTENAIVPAAWATRHFSVTELDELFTDCTPKLIEISKDLADSVSLKALGQILDRIRSKTQTEIAFAGTSDLVSCAGLAWPRYRLYLAVQFAQARSLDCSLFRLLMGQENPAVSVDEFIQRVLDVCADLSPMTACFEMHGGIECNPVVLRKLMQATSVKVVIDLENLQRAGMSAEQLLASVPLDRIAYVHQRNLPDVWTEHEPSLSDERYWRELLPGTPFLWEPKTVAGPDQIRELFSEYRRSY